jgi:cytidylate kinase
VDYATVLETIRRRDEIDSGRSVAPLRPAEDAFYLCNDHLTVEEEKALILGLLDG